MEAQTMQAQSRGAHNGKPAQSRVGQDVPGLTSDWDFVRTPPSPRLILKTAVMLAHRTRLRPPHRVLKPMTPRQAWMVYFVFSPSGELSTSHRFTLARLRDMGCGVLVVCATRDPIDVPEELLGLSDALCWKGLGGYDFSAYTLALETIAQHSPHADVFVMNDSIFGPFEDIRPFMKHSRWELSGFTASSDTVNHIQSYAFILKDVTPHRLEKLRSAFPRFVAFNRAIDAILWQELRFASVASRHMAVGSFWYSDAGWGSDPTLLKPFDLLRAGFPFMKKSLLGKHGKFQSQEAAMTELLRLGHPAV